MRTRPSPDPEAVGVDPHWPISRPHSNNPVFDTRLQNR